jgi:hypothetical protein
VAAGIILLGIFWLRRGPVGNRVRTQPHRRERHVLTSTPSLLGQAILADLHTVHTQRQLRAQDAALAARVLSLKAYQHARFAHTYADLLASERHGPAARFFLDDLYGPGDFTQRDTQFARVVPALVRLFPADLVQTVAALSGLHALSEQLDTALAGAGSSPQWTAANYRQAWCSSCTPPDRERQITLTLEVGQSLDRYTRKPLLRQSLRLMRGPASAAGLGTLQTFLERGFDTFRAMRGADAFLTTIAQRERALAAQLFGSAD